MFFIKAAAYFCADYYYWSRGTGAGSAQSYHGFLFDASACNDIYGASETVQPPAYTVYYIIKISRYCYQDK